MKLPVAFTFALASAAGGVEASFNKTSTVFEHPSNDATEFRASIHVRAVDRGTPFPSPSDRGTPFPTPSTGITPFPTEGEDELTTIGSNSAKEVRLFLLINRVSRSYNVLTHYCASFSLPSPQARLRQHPSRGALKLPSLFQPLHFLPKHHQSKPPRPRPPSFPRRKVRRCRHRPL